MTGWLQAASPQEVQFSKFGRDDLLDIQRLGCDVVRLPVNLHGMTSGPPSYRIDPLLYAFLDPIAAWANELGLHLILDNHSFDPSVDTSPQVGQVLVPVWRQLAAHFADHPARLYYEVLSEPHGIADTTWNRIQGEVIEAIRQVDQRHAIVVGPAAWNSYHNLRQMPFYADDNLIYTFHFYDPFVFTHQGASWITPSMVPLAGVPFPYDPARMPAIPPSLMGSWVGSELDNYPNEGTVERVQALLDIAADFKAERGVPLFCGELGVYMPNSDNRDRVFWYDVVRRHLEEQGIGWTIWNYRGGYGLFEHGSNELFDFDLNVPLLEALGLAVPPQRAFVLEPDREGFSLYEDFIGPDPSTSSTMPRRGRFPTTQNRSQPLATIASIGPGRGNTSLSASTSGPVKDLTVLAATGYAVEFWVRGDTPGASFDIRLIDTDTADPADHPWRMAYTIDERLAAWDGMWHKVRVPLADFAEQGTWEDEWFNPIGAFDWQAIDRFDIVAERGDLTDVHFWFDNVRIAGLGPTAVFDEAASRPAALALAANYPNPFNAMTAIRYAILNYALPWCNGMGADAGGQRSGGLCAERPASADAGEYKGAAATPGTAWHVAAMGWARRCGASGGQRCVLVSLGCYRWGATVAVKVFSG